MTRRTRSDAPLVMLVLLVAGCSSGDEHTKREMTDGGGTRGTKTGGSGGSHDGQMGGGGGDAHGAGGSRGAGVHDSDGGSSGAGGNAAGDGGHAAGDGGHTAGDGGHTAHSDADGGNGSGLAGPLKVSSNPRYFEDQNGDALILMGSHTWNNLQNWGANGAPQALDFDAYTKFLVDHGHNFTLLWRTELPKFCGLPTLSSDSPDITTDIQPWPRTGPGNANDGGAKFDLSKFDDAFFDRLRSRVAKLNEAGIWVGVYLFTGEWLNVFRCASSDGFPLSAANNINSIDDGGGNGSMTMTSPNAISDIEDAMVDHTIDVLNDLPNVLWIVSEEAPPSTSWWQGHMIDHVRSYESHKPLQHPIGIGQITGADDSEIYDTDADWVSPAARISPSMTCGSGSPACKVNLNDSDHSYFGMWNESAQQNRQYAWENFVSGNQVVFMDPYTLYYPRENRNPCASPDNAICSAPDARWDNFRDNLGYILRYSRKLDLERAEPSTTLCSTHYCIGQAKAAGTELLVYAPDGGTFSVDLSAASGRSLNFEWFDPATGEVVSNGSVQGGNGGESFVTPGSIADDAVLYIVDSAGHA